MASLVRTYLFRLMVLFLTLVTGIASIVLLPLPSRYMRALGVVWCRAVLTLARVIVGISYEVNGTLPTEPMIIAARHESAYETILLMALLPTMVPIVKHELLWIPIYGWTIWKMGVIAIPRTKKVTALRSIQQQVQQLHGTPIVIFPEGTRMPVGVAGRIQSSIVAVYEASGLPVQPVAVQSGHVWPKRGLMQAGIVTLTLQPIIPAGLPRAELLATLAKSIAP